MVGLSFPIFTMGIAIEETVLPTAYSTGCLHNENMQYLDSRVCFLILF